MKESIVDGRIKKALESRTDSVTMLESLDAISDFFGKQGNTVDTRRALRQDLEHQNIQLAKKFLVEFAEVREQMTVVEADIAMIESECSRMATAVSSADENMKLFMQRASQLEGNRNFYSQQSEDITLFLSRFQLTQQEVDELQTLSLQESSVEVFFNAFKRLRHAYEDCKAMVEVYQYSAGFELLDLLGHHQDCGYQRLFEWVKEQCENISTSTSEYNDVHLQTAVAYLREVPAYYTQCQDLVVSSRRSLLVRKFVLAMGQNLENRTGRHLSRPSDKQTNDAVRHMSNMLAWVHQVIASEEEFLCAIFFGSNRSALKAVDRSFTFDEASASPSVKDLLVRCLHGLGRPLKTRITQILTDVGDDIEVGYVICDLLTFYEVTISKMIPSTNSVQVVVRECLTHCKTMFEDTLLKFADKVRASSTSTFAVDTSATAFTNECAHILQNVLHGYESALALQNMDETEAGCFDINFVVSSFVHPYLQGCRTCGNNTFPEKSDMAVFMVNNVCALKSVFLQCSISTVSSWVDLLNSELSSWIDVLVIDGSSRLLQRSDMDKLQDLIELLPETMVASEQPGLGSDRVGTVLRAFYASLVSTGSSLADRITDPDMRESTRKLTAQKVADSYKLVHSVISDNKNKYNSGQLLAYSPDEVEVLLGCST